MHFKYLPLKFRYIIIWIILARNTLNIALSLCLGVVFSALCALPGEAATFASTSRLATGRWVKIHVDSTSVYRISYDRLREWGFSNPASVSVYGYGSAELDHVLDSAPDDLPPVPVYHHDGALYFYGEGDIRVRPASESMVSVNRNYYSNGSCYFLTEGRSVTSIPESSYGTSSVSALSTHLSVDYRLTEEINFDNAGVFFYSRNLVDNPARDFTFAAPDYSSGGTLGFQYVYNHSNTSATPSISLDFSSAADVTPFTLTGMKHTDYSNVVYQVSRNQTVNVAPVDKSRGSFTASFSNPAGSPFSDLNIDYVYYIYNRDNRFLGPVMQLHMLNVPAGTPVAISDAPDGMLVWDVSLPREAASLSTTAAANGAVTVTLPACSSSARKLCAFVPDSRLPEPTFVGPVTNTNLHLMQPVELLIVTTTECKAEAMRLAEAHRSYQGMLVGVVDQQDVFNEFSSGSSHPSAIRKFAKMIYSRPGTTLKYLLLMGGSTFDARGKLGEDNTEYLVNYEVELQETARYNSRDYSADQYFGFFDDKMPADLPSLGSSLTIGVGRVPVLSAAEARIYVDKCITYLANPSIAGDYCHAMVMADCGDTNTHFNAAESSVSVMSLAAPQVYSSKLYEVLYARDGVRSTILGNAVANQIAAGPRVVSYTGHANIMALGSNMFLTMADERKLHYGSMPFMFLATCYALPIDRPFRGIGCQFLLDNNGAIAVIGSSRSVYMNYNHTLNDAVLRQYYSAIDGDCIGDVWRKAYNATKTSRGQRLNNLCYNLAGNPALPVYPPSRTIAVTAIDGVAPGAIPMSKPSLSPMVVSGEIRDNKGNRDASFSGTMTLRLLEAPRTMTSFVYGGSDTPQSVKLEETIIFETPVEVADGVWKVTMTPPLSNVSGVSRMVMTSWSDDGKTLATGQCSALSLVAPNSGDVADSTPPSITIYLDRPSMVDGDDVSSSPMLYVKVADSGSGVDMNRAAIGCAPKVVLDDDVTLKEAAALFRPDDDGGYTMAYQLSGLGDGQHYITVSARDLAGNISSSTISFVVVNDEVVATLSVNDKIVREGVEFDLQHSISSIPTVRLMIEDMLGNTVYSKEGASFPYVWDFRGSDGEFVADGMYRAYAILESHPRYASTPRVEFTVVK